MTSSTWYETRAGLPRSGSDAAQGVRVRLGLFSLLLLQAGSREQ